MRMFGGKLLYVPRIARSGSSQGERRRVCTHVDPSIMQLISVLETISARGYSVALVSKAVDQGEKIPGVDYKVTSMEIANIHRGL